MPIGISTKSSISRIKSMKSGSRLDPRNSADSSDSDHTASSDSSTGGSSLKDSSTGSVSLPLSKKRASMMFLNLGNNSNNSSNCTIKINDRIASPTSVTSNASTIKSSVENDRIIKSLLKQFKSLELELNKFNSRKFNNSKNSGVLKSNILRTSLLPFLRKNSNYLNHYFDKDSKVYKSLISVIIAILLKWWSSLLGNLSSANVPAAPSPNPAVASVPNLTSAATATTAPMSAPPSSRSAPASKSSSPASSTSSFSDPSTIYYNVVPASDRNAYLECISRIVARDDWNNVDEDFYNQYQVLLTTTLDYCIDKMSTLKTLSLSMSAFIGKIFAYSFFRLPDVANALLFLLNVKQAVFDDTVKILNTSPSSANYRALYSAFPAHLHYLIAFKGLSLKSRKKASYLNCVPPPKHPVNGIKDPNAGWVRRWCNCDSNVFNSFFRHYIDFSQKSIAPYIYTEDAAPTLAPPPLVKQDTDSMEATNELLIVNLPGFNIILSHLLQIFQVSVNRISTNSYNKFNSPSPVVSSQKQQQKLRSLQKKSVDGPMPQTVRNNGGPVPPPAPPPPTSLPNNFNIKQCDVYYNSIIKIFRTLRDIVNSSILESDDKSLDLVTSNLVRFVDQALICIAKETSVYQCNKNGLLLNIVTEYINHVHNNLDVPNTLIDWEFWLSCNYVMIKNTDHIQVLLKSFAFLFNIWDMIPECLSQHRNEHSRAPGQEWLVDFDESYKVNFIDWLIGNEMFQRFIVHWNPIIRSYYLRLLIWRVVGVNNYQSSTMIQITRKVQHKLSRSYEILHEFSVDVNSPAANFHLNYKPDNPLVNRKFGVLSASPKEDGLSVYDENGSEFMPATTPISKTSDLRKTHSYEVFDEAIYTCSSLPLGSADSSATSTPPPSMEQPKAKVAPVKSLASSLGKFFRYLSSDESVTNEDDDEQPPPIIFKKIDSNKSLNNLSNGSRLRIKRNSVSLSSLSTAYSSTRSRSSSPSLLSFNSLPLTDSTSSSVQSELDSLPESMSTIDNGKPKKGRSVTNQLPELSRLPPDIIRPMYKFDIIIDHESMNEKFMLIHHHNGRIGRQDSLVPLAVTERQVSYFPLRPRIPSLSIYINSDPYNNIYINDEDGLYIENFRGDESEDDVEIYDQETYELFKGMTHTKSAVVTMTNLGRSLNELNSMIDEFKAYLNKKVEVDQFNRDLTMAENLNEFDYFKKIIPFLSVDSSNELKLLNAN